MFKRDISDAEVRLILKTGEIIKDYNDDKPYPSHLLLGFAGQRPLHLLVAKDSETGNCILVTIYEPYKTIWSNDYKMKIR